MPEAGEVFLIWGIDGWQPLPESLRPAGTEIKNKLMRTLMHQEGDTFVVRTQVPIGVTINYGFMITDKRGIFDAVSHVWDGGQDYQTIASASGVVEVKPQLTLNNEWSNILDISLYLLVGVGILLAVWLAMFLVPGFLGRQTIRRWLLPCFLALSLWSIFLWPASVLADSPLATQEIRYNLPEAGEIFLVWGINGWNVLPKEMWPAGTILKDNLMYTPMVREDETFVARVRVPSGATIDYVFQITKTAGGASIEVWDANGNPKQDYHTAAVQDGSVAIQAMPVIQDQLRASSSASADVTQEIRYHLPIAGEVFFVWGINGWQMTPEETRPSGTVIKNEVMHTPMTREADFFVARIQTPARAMIDYGFLITKKRNGDAIKAVWDGEQDYRMTATEDGIVEVKPELSLLRDQISANVVNVNRQWRGVLLLIIGFVLAFGAGFIRRYPPLNHVVSPYLNYLNNDISKLIMFAIASRLLLLSIAYLSQVSIANLNEDYVTFKATYLEQVISPFGRGDVWWYMDIAQNGYEHRPFSTEKHANWAFYPLWPIVLKLGSFFIPDMLISGLILSNIFFLLSLIFLYQLISIDFDRNIAMLTSFLVIIFPASHFLSRPGPEALFLFLVVATLLCAKKNQWLLTGIIGSLAVLSRLQGLLLVLPLLFIYYKHYRVSQKHDIRVLSLLMIPAALLLLMFYMYWLTGNILANFAIQEAWDHHLSYPFAAMIQFLAKPDVINYYGWSLSPVNFIFLFFALVLTGFMIKKPEIPREYLIYTLLSIYLIIARDSLQASLRFMIPVFPLYLILSLLIYNKRTLSNFIFFSFISLQLFYFLAFVQEYNWAAT
jgi:Gpi18-like mannosyltransferase